MTTISEFEFKKMIRDAEIERDKLITEKPELKALQDGIDRDFEIIGDNPVARLKILFQSINARVAIINQELDAMKKYNSHARKMIAAAAPMFEEKQEQIDSINDNLKKGFENMFKDGVIPKSGSIKLFDDNE